MTQPFFRPEVIEARRGSWLGAVSLAQPPGFRRLVMLAAALALAMLAFLFFGTYTQRASASGQLQSIGAPGDPLAARLLVPSRSIAAIVPGDIVRMRYDAFPFQKFGHQAGTVLRVADVPADARRRRALGVAAADGESWYEVEVALEQPWVVAYGERHALRPGTGVKAEIMGERRRLLAWLMDPAYSARGRVGPPAP